MSIRKGYSDGPFGQIHWRMAAPECETTKPDLYCLHPAPFSGLAYSVIMPFLAQGRRAIAPDYPGCGGSDKFVPEPSIAQYAEAMLAVVADLSDGAVDVTGFHTGNLVAIEMALQSPDKINALALVDVPAFDETIRAKFLATSAAPLEITAELSCLEKPWNRGMTKRFESQGPERSFEMFVEQIRHGKDMNAAFHAAFTYDVEGRLCALKEPVSIIATQSGLLDATRRAANLLPNAQLIQRLDIQSAVLDEAAEKTAAQIVEILDGFAL